MPIEWKTTCHEDCQFAIKSNDQECPIQCERDDILRSTSAICPFGSFISVNTSEDKVVEHSPSESVKPDMVNHPPHYTAGGIECIDAIKAATGDGFEFFLQGQVIKYIWGYRHKNGKEDLEKAKWYLNKLIEECYE